MKYNFYFIRGELFYTFTNAALTSLSVLAFFVILGS